MESCSACRGQILNQNQATSNLLVAFELLRLLYPPECAGGGARDRVVLHAADLHRERTSALSEAGHLFSTLS